MVKIDVFFSSAPKYIVFTFNLSVSLNSLFIKAAQMPFFLYPFSTYKAAIQGDKFRKGFNKLCQKQRKIYLPVPEKEGNFVITNIIFLEEKKELILSSSNCNKKYRAFYIPKSIIFLHKEYGYFKIPSFMFNYF